MHRNIHPSTHTERSKNTGKREGKERKGKERKGSRDENTAFDIKVFINTSFSLPRSPARSPPPRHHPKEACQRTPRGAPPPAISPQECALSPATRLPWPA
eukprot:scaffold396_cov252-Pinguiococcus_pyrenoidosus.AAC.1